MLSRYTLDVYADEAGVIESHRIKRLLDDAESLGATGWAGIDLVPPIVGGDPRPWGIRIVITEKADLADDR